MTDQTFTLKEIEPMIDFLIRNAKNIESKHIAELKSDAIKGLTKPKQEFVPAINQVYAYTDSAGIECMEKVNESHLWCTTNARPLTPEEAGPHLVPRAEFDKLRDVLTRLANADSSEFDPYPQAFISKALDSLPENLK